MDWKAKRVMIKTIEDEDEDLNDDDLEFNE
jgi:hypothetical protein